MSQMLKSSGALAAATMTSRILGLVRDVAYARFMGTSWVASAFILAFMIPNLFRRLLGEGALTAAFIPIFKQKEKQEGEPAMWASANAVLNGLVLILSLIVFLSMAAISLALIIHPFEGKTLLMLNLLRTMFPYVLLVCVAALFMAMLNARGHFFVPALGSALLNVILISSVLFLAPHLGTSTSSQVYGLAIGVLAAGVAQALFQLPLLRSEGFRFQAVAPWNHPTVRKVIRQMIPGIMGVAAYQINVLLTNAFAFWVADNVVASFNFAVRVMELPQGVFGLSLANYLLPTLAGLAADKKYPEFRATMNQGLGYLLFVNLLAAALLLTLAEPMVRLLFERGEFDAYGTDRTARALVCLAPGLIAFSAVNILGRAFYALGDLQTPMRISVFCLVTNLILVAALIWKYQEIGMGIANSATAFLNMALLAFALRKKLGRLDLAELKSHLPGLLAATVAAGAAAYLLRLGWENRFGHEHLWQRLGEVFMPMGAASVVYLGVTHWLKLPYSREFAGLIASRFRRGRR